MFWLIFTFVVYYCNPVSIFINYKLMKKLFAVLTLCVQNQMVAEQIKKWWIDDC